MRRFLISLMAFVALPAVAQSTDDTAAAATTDEAVTAIVVADPIAPRDATELDLTEFLWVARPIVVFADTPADPRFVEQMELLAERMEPLLERDVVILFDTDPSANSAIRRELRPRGFAVVVISKDGAVGLRRPSPRDVREIIRAIDNFSLRQEEVRRGG